MQTLLIIITITAISSLTGIAMVSIFRFDSNNAIFALLSFSILLTIYCEINRRKILR
jgi:hypothetical protein